ncbi:MAG: DUF2007 domain-containing protein [Chloroflexi bacterium]|nr:DUF2007 domain-containing protein [Chloroflexota bacterium]
MKDNKELHELGRGKGELVKVCTASGQLEANVLKSRLEAEGIPSLLRYDSASSVFGIYFDGLGRVDIMVPVELAEDAARVLSSKPDLITDADTEPENNSGER